MSKADTIIKVQFSEPPLASEPNRTEFYFGGLAAIYDLFTPEQVGCGVKHLWNYGITVDRPYRNRRCVVSKEVMRRKTRREDCKER